MCAVAPIVTEHRVGRGTGLEVRVKKQSHLGWQWCFRKINLQTKWKVGRKSHVRLYGERGQGLSSGSSCRDGFKETVNKT